MKRIPLIKSVMTPFPYSLDMDDTIDAASKMMAEHDIRHLPVTDKGRPVGVISSKDIKRALDTQHSGSGEEDHLVRDIANLDIYIVDFAAPLDDVVLEMASQHNATALVVRKGRLIGIFTASDAFKCLGHFLKTLYPRDGDDAA